ncbi:hypothetical protein BGZ63DRAFT_395856 [Mariannaea sp. PMI_226]|nr:hypothetical protein BGZ63DRAFT_395856 [Mariannaea sp. PMI_226]
MQNPSIPGEWSKDTPKDTPREEQQDPVDTQSVPRSAGVVSEAGNVVDDSGKEIGKLAEDLDPKELIGKTVTTGGDIIDASGDVVGKAEIPEELGEYTTTPAKKTSGFGLSGLRSAYNTVDESFRPVTSRLGLGSKSGSEQKSTPQSEATERQPKEKLGQKQVQEEGSGINLEDRDQSLTGKESDKGLQEVPPMPEGETTKSDDVNNQEDFGDTIKPDDSVSRFDDTAKTTSEKKESPPEGLKEVESKAPEPPGSGVESQKEETVPKGTDLGRDTTRSVPGGGETDLEKKDVPLEGTEVEKEGTTVPAESQVETKTQEEAPGTNVPETEIPKSEVPESHVPPSEPPESLGGEGTDLGKEGTDIGKDGTDIGEKATEPEKEGEKETEKEEEEEAVIDYAALEGCTVNKGGNLVNDNGDMVGRIVQGELKQLVGKRADENGDIWNDSGKKIGKAEPLPDNEREDLKDFAPFENFPGAVVDADGRVLFEGKQVGQVVEGDPKRLKGSKVDEDGDILDRRGNVVGKAEAWDEPEAVETAKVDCSILDGKRVNKVGNVVDQDGKIFGRVVEGDLKHLVGKRADSNGDFWDDSGNKIGRAEPVSDKEREDLKDFAPFENFPGAVVDADGRRVMFEGKQVGEVVEGDPKRIKGSKVDEDGDILDRRGNVVGKAEAWEEPEAEPEPEVDNSALAGKRVNKAGNVVDSNGTIFGRVVEGHIGSVVGRMCDKDGNIRGESGDVIGRAELVPESEREGAKDGPFADIGPCSVGKEGKVILTQSDEVVGRLVSGDPKALFGRPVDEDGDILDRNGNVIGTAERWEEPEPEPEAAIDYSVLGGKRVNKAGNVVDSSGVIYGRVVEGHIGSVIGRMCDKEGNIRSESGEVIGRAELVPEGQREGVKDGPFAELQGCTVGKDGKVVTPAGDVVGRLVSGDPKLLKGRAVDEDGDILDRNGNVIGKAERWEEEEIEKKRDPLAGRRVNREGNVVDDDGNIIGKLTSGDLFICSGKEVDEDGDVVNQKGQTIGHVSRLEDIPPEPEPEPEETETEEEKTKREEAEKDRKLAGQLAYCVEQALDKIRPICKMITDKIDRAERTPKEELDEEELVKQVKPLIEEGGKILTETNGVIRGLDPDGRIQRNAKHRSATREGSPEEFHLAEVLKELTGTVTQCIDNAKRKIEDMPHAKEELNPLWGLLGEPLFQILAAVGLLLSGVLGIVGRLVSLIAPNKNLLKLLLMCICS